MARSGTSSSPSSTTGRSACSRAGPRLRRPIDELRDCLGWLREQPVAKVWGGKEYHAFCPVHDRYVRLERGLTPAPPEQPLRIHPDDQGTVESLECDAGCTQREVLASIGLSMVDLIGNPWDDGDASAGAAGRSAPSRAAQAADAQPQPQPRPQPAYEAVVVRLSQVQPEPLQWLWPGRIPLGKLTVIAGDPGLGKTFLTHDIAARVSRGGRWPDAEVHGVDADDGRSTKPLGDPAEAGDVVLLSAEDGLADTIRPRLESAGANLQRIVALTAVRGVDGHEASFSLARDLASLQMVLQQCQRPRLVVIDPISAYLSRTDSHNNAEVRALLAPLAAMADRHRVAVIAINHLNKGGGSGSGKAIYRSMGSLAFIAAARAGWLIARGNDDPERRLMLVAKMNVAREPDGLSYRIIDGRIAWDREPVRMTADEALGTTASGEIDRNQAPRLAEAVDLINEHLAGGEVESGGLARAAAARGITQATLKRARGIVGVTPHRVGFGPGSRLMLSRAIDQPDPSQPTLLDVHPPIPAHAPR